MANYNCTVRTNYFHVKDPEKFREFMNHVYGSEDSIDLWEEKDSGGNPVFGFGVYGGISGLRSSLKHESKLKHDKGKPMIIYQSIGRIDRRINGARTSILYNPAFASHETVVGLIYGNAPKTEDEQAAKDSLCFVTPKQAGSLLSPNTKNQSETDFYIGQDGTSGIQAENWQEFVDYLYDAYCDAVKTGKKHFDIKIESGGEE